MAGFHGIVVVIAEDVHECEVAAIYPSPTLDHQLFVRFHGICIGDCVRDIFQCIFSVLLAVYTQR